MERRRKTQQILERSIGKSISELTAMDLSEEIRFVEEKTQRPLHFSKTVDSRTSSRGNPYIAHGRLYTMEDVNKRIAELK